jgi:Zn-dependent peptidase ImmA (M78 family)
MSLQVPYIADEIIERDAEALLAQYAQGRGVEIKPPIPIEDIVEKHLKLHVEFDDLPRRLEIPRKAGREQDILGAIWLETGHIVIDESLDPEERPSREGRYRFTLAHEGGGHWRLHRPLVLATRGQQSLFVDAEQPTIICRSSQSKQRAEVQADLYASCLLMPRKLVRQAWRERFGSEHPRILRRKERVPLRNDIDGSLAEQVSAYEQERDQQALENFARPFAEKFLVSPIAMRIRLERLGLLHREIPKQQPLLAWERVL